jgi:predicted XRE-type DNA-binding protein
LAELVDQGRFKGHADAARQLGVSRARISYILRHDLKREIPSTRDKLLKLVHAGRAKDHADAARQLGVSRPRVSFILSREGVSIPRRSAGVPITCPGCGSVRSVKPSAAASRSTNLCRSCWLASLKRPATTMEEVLTELREAARRLRLASDPHTDRIEGAMPTPEVR